MVEKLNIDLSYCYGIRQLKQEFDYSATNAVALYAPNGAMKSSLAKTFRDLAAGKPSGDRIFPGRKSSRTITDHTSAPVAADSILVIEPYDEVFSHSEKTSTLLVNAALRKEYEQLHEAIGVAKELFLKSVKAHIPIPERAAPAQRPEGSIWAGRVRSPVTSVIRRCRRWSPGAPPKPIWRAASMSASRRYRGWQNQRPSPLISYFDKIPTAQKHDLKV